MSRASIVFPIRFATAQTAVQTTTKELSPSGVAVRCLTPPAVWTAISLKLYLPGGAPALEARAIVREVSCGAESGFWAEFDQLGSHQREQISLVLQRRLGTEGAPIGAAELRPASGSDKRSFPRINTRFAVRFATVQDFVLEYAANISAGGVFVQTDNPPPLKSVVRVELELPDGSEPLAAQGLVVHRLTPEEAKKRNTVPGMGVQFVGADDEFRRRIDEAIERLIREGR